MSKDLALHVRATIFCFEIGKGVVEKDALTISGTHSRALLHRSRESLAPVS